MKGFVTDLRRTTLKIAISLLLLVRLIKGDPTSPGSEGQLKGPSLEELGNIEVTTASKEPVKVSRTPAAIYVITQGDIRRSGATSIPEALRLAPGVEVARIDAVKWSIGIRGFGSRLSRNVLVVIDGRTVAKVGPGDCVGEMSLLDGGRRTATVTAAVELTCTEFVTS